MRTYSANGIVLKRIDLGEKDRILTLYTREMGKLSAVAKGARRPGSKLSGTSEPFTYSKVFLAAGRELDVLTQAEIKESFPAVKNSITTIAYGLYMLDLVNGFTEERESNSELFDTLLSAMYILENGADPQLTLLYFELHLMILLGYEPQFYECIRCENEIGKGKIAFSPSLGGVVCDDCGSLPADAIIVPNAVISYVEALKKAEPQKLKNMKFPKGAMKDLAQMLRWHIRYRLEHDLKSEEFLDRVAAWELP